MTWRNKYNQCEYDILMYGLFCQPCLFGENTSSIMKHPSCISHTFSYSALGFSSSWLGSLLGNVICPGSDLAMIGGSSLCYGCLIGTYGGEMRTRLRQKYGINGTPNQDVLMHFFCSPCAVCQEAQEIRLRKNENHYHEIPSAPCEWKPMHQEMNK